MAWNQGQLPGMEDSHDWHPSPRDDKNEWTHGSGTGAHHNVSGDQLRMFMTPREIKSTYQVLDGDRQEVYDDRGGELTNRTYTTGGNTNEPIATNLRQGAVPGSRDYGAKWMHQRHGSELQRHSHIRTDVEGMETDEQVWDRKLDESQMSPEEYGEVHGMSSAQGRGPMDYDELMEHSSAPVRAETRPELGSTWNAERQESYEGAMESRLGRENAKWEARYGAEAPSLYEHIQAHGVENPVHLGTNVGGEGKPEVVGGHHRIAAAASINDQQLIPVLHHEDIRSARSRQSPFKYT